MNTILRWSARSLSILVLGVLLVFAIGEGLNLSRFTGRELLLFAFFPLGICVGMQALFETSSEMGTHAGLGLLPGRVVHFPPLDPLKVPQTGWNRLWPQGQETSPLLEGLAPGPYAYFNHSFYCDPARPADIAATTDYGISFASMVQHEALYGVQFHPEKSQRVGQQILANFMRLHGALT